MSGSINGCYLAELGVWARVRGPPWPHPTHRRTRAVTHLSPQASQGDSISLSKAL